MMFKFMLNWIWRQPAGVLGLRTRMDFMHILIHYKMETDISVRMIDFFFSFFLDDHILGLSHEIWCM